MNKLVSARLFLNKLQRKNVSSKYVDWLNNPLVNKFLESRHVHWDFNSVAKFVEAKSFKTNEFLYGIFLRDACKHIGNISIGPVHEFHPVAPISLLIGDSTEWGKRYASEAIEIICRFGFEDLDLQNITAGMYALNVPSIRAFEKAGFAREGHLRCHRFFEGRMVDAYQYALLRSEWRRLDNLETKA